MAETVSRKSLIFDILYDFKEGNKSAKQAADALANVDKKANNLVTKTLKDLRNAFAGAFAAQQIIQFAKETVKLAGEVDGVRRAFDRLNNSQKLLNDLKEATAGTVSELQLMKQAVRAQNFQVPLEKLATFFEFARKRAAATGESVDYLVTSIIDGIGRKSTLVLDNLGISATQLQEEIKLVGDFGQAAGNIIERELGKMDNSAITTGQRIAQISSEFDNLKAAIGTVLLGAGFGFIDWLTDLKEGFTDLISLTNAFTEEIENLETAIQELDQDDVKNINDLSEAFKIAGEEAQRTGKTIFEQFEVINESGQKVTTTLLELAKQQVAQRQEAERLEQVENDLNQAYQERINKLRELGALLGQAQQLQKGNIDSLETQTLTTEAAGKVQGNYNAVVSEGMMTVDQYANSVLQSSAAAIQAATGSSEAAKIFVLAQQAQAIATGIAEAVKIGFPQNIPAIFTSIATIAAAFATIQSFAEGTDYLDSPDAPHGRDTIPIMADRGEAIIPKRRNREKPGLARAWINGTLDEYIQTNYIDPAMLNVEITEKNEQLDYSNRFYKQLLATNEGNHSTKKMVHLLYDIKRNTSYNKIALKYSR